MRRAHWPVALLTFAYITGCATVSTDRGTSTSRSSDILTREELATVAGTTQNAYSAVERLRPLFLATRPRSATVQGAKPHIHVFINGSLAGDVDVLKMMPLGSIESIRRVQATAAFTQHGGIHSGDGVLMVQVR